MVPMFLTIVDPEMASKGARRDDGGVIVPPPRAVVEVVGARLHCPGNALVLDFRTGAAADFFEPDTTRRVITAASGARSVDVDVVAVVGGLRAAAAAAEPAPAPNAENEAAAAVGEGERLADEAPEEQVEAGVPALDRVLSAARPSAPGEGKCCCRVTLLPKVR